jgi:hypothetical protein
LTANGTQDGFKVAVRREPPGVSLEVFNPSTGRLAPIRCELSGIELKVPVPESPQRVIVPEFDALVIARVVGINEN